MLIAYPDGAQSARISPWEVSALVGGGADPSVLLGWVPDAPPWLDDERLHGITAMGGYALTGVIASGRLEYLPVRLGGVPALIEGTLRPDVVVVGAVRRGDWFAYNGAVGWAPAAVRAARIVVVEVDEKAFDLGAPLIDARIDHVVTRDASYEPVPVSRSLDATDLAVGRAVVSMLPDEPTLQLGPGGIAEAIVQSIDRPVGLRSGLITDAMAELAGRNLLRGRAVGGYTWGGEAIVSLAAAGRLDLQPVEVTHDVGAIARTKRMVACNTAVQLGLDGSVNVERVGGRLVAGIGGHADFCAGAVLCPTGLSIIAFRSTTRSGQSTIVPRVDVVSTARSDVDLVITEHGVADLRGVGDAERRARIISVAAPEHRDELAGSAGHVSKDSSREA